MSAFETTLRVDERVAVVPSEDDRGRKVEAQMILQNIMLLPVGPGQVAGIPIGVYRIPLSKVAIKNLIQSLTEVEAELVEPTNIELAGSMADAQNLARAQEGVLGARR
jgi:hypothetical protein